MPTTRTAPGDVFEIFVLAPGPVPAPPRAEGARGSSDPAQVLAAFRNARVVAPFPRRGGESGARWQRIIRAHEDLVAVLEGRAPRRALPTGAQLRDLGRDLFEALLPGEVRRLYDVARSMQGSRPLDVVFTSMLDWVADKPWELAFDPSRREFLTVSSVNLVRNAFTAVPAEAHPSRRGRLGILAAVSEPRGALPLDVQAETTDLRKAFRPLVSRGRARIEVLTRVTPGALQRRLAKGGLDVLHFVGHGDFDEKEREGSLLLEDERGRPRRLGAEALRQLLCQRGLRLVFLNACETGRGGRVDWTRGVAPALVAAGIPAVVANQYAVKDAAATAFAGELYAQVASGQPLGAAVREARLALFRDLGPTTIDWAVPVVFARDPRETLR